MNILSIHLGHDSSACMLKNGELVLYFKEERLSREKRDSFPYLSTKSIFQNFNEEIDFVCFSSVISPSPRFFLDYLIKQHNIEVNKIITFDTVHHLSHSFYAFCNSGFEKCISLVIDGAGSAFFNTLSECESIFYHDQDITSLEIQKNLYKSIYNPKIHLGIDIGESYNKIKRHFDCEINYNGTVGGIVALYNTAPFLISQTLFDNGKLMGLSSYGEKIDNFPKLFSDKNGKVREELFDLDYRNSTILLKSYKHKVTKEITKQNYKLYADYAYEIQTQTQEAVGNIIEKSIEKTGINKVCISGGYGMNVVANHYYMKRFPNVDFYFEPMSDDSCISIGAAKLFFHEQNKNVKINCIGTTSFHGVYHDVSKYKGKISLVEDIARLLYEDKSVAIYTGLAEAGQRALGNRSILFNALNPNAKELVNKIKKREWYRPFACMVLVEDANTYFDMGKIKSSPFMTICFPVRPEYVKIISGVTHVDNTCRIQTVSKNDGYLYELLQNFKRLSGHGILLNTSFNLAGEPLVETPEDAFNTLNNSCLDYLWFEETRQIFKS